jgi:hypothetical protein
MMRLVRVDQQVLVGQSEVVLELSPSEVGALALEMTLLLSTLSEGIKIGASSGPYAEISIDPNEKWAKAFAASDNLIRFEIGKNQAEYLQMVLLRAYRDQMAEVNHIHIEGTSGEGLVNLDLTIMFKVYAPPVSGDEAKKLLGL